MVTHTYNPPVFTTPPPTPTTTETPLTPTTSVTMTFPDVSIVSEPRQSPERKPVITNSTFTIHPMGLTQCSTRAQALLDFSRRISQNNLPNAVKHQVLETVARQMEEAANSEESSEEQREELRQRVAKYHKAVDVKVRRRFLRDNGRERVTRFGGWLKFISSEEREERRRRRKEEEEEREKENAGS